MRIIPRKMYGIDLMFGSEINIIDHDGTLSMEEKIIEKTLDIRIAGIHLPCYEVGTVTQNTNAYVKAIENPMIDIISHPDDSRIPIDYEMIVDAAKENHTLLEINNSSLDSLSSRVGAWQNLQIMLQMCEEKKVCLLYTSKRKERSELFLMKQRRRSYNKQKNSVSVQESQKKG